MVKVKKLGAFGGVFVPSILTILGVIMYLRLPWIVGHAGLYSTLAIIFVAHLISISTGLSISSIATDKKVETGGTYFMISRSLGLAIGGTLGLALFVGLSFSVSLYLIGFSEAFLSFFGMDTSLASIRKTGFIVLSSVTLITFISTKLAIKTQYLILLAMILSLASIFIGGTESTTAVPQLRSFSDSVPWIVLFGIFFPAVTGFEAGVSMSGDLADPRKAIPRGTISAIFIGLVMYVVLAFFFSYYVSGSELRDNPNVLFDVSRFRYLVVAGIWGATLSSALGSILAAPRILQAISIDKITPKFFGKGYGALNEPRNALILSFFIALGGIMIGELNAIARIVTIFFIITYGFLNLSCFIENWASSDFRPSFRIHPIISIVGALACFVVMIQLDVLAMIGATIVLSGVFLLLKRKELALSSGDTWNSVWMTIIKNGLLRLQRKTVKTRNWQPNIILFSGGQGARPHLTEMGKEISGKLGMLTDFELVPADQGKENKQKATIAEDSHSGGNDSVFHKRIESSDIYKSIENISSIYGFSGIEPNTVMLGFPNDPGKAEDFLKIHNALGKTNFNSIFVKYNKDIGYGNRKKIDVWWTGESDFLNFSLTILRFLTSGFAWRRSHCTLYFLNNRGIPSEEAIQKIRGVLNDYRIKLEIKVIRTTKRDDDVIPFIQNESSGSDLIITQYKSSGMKKQLEYIKQLQSESAKLPSMLLLRPSEFFDSSPLFGKEIKISDRAYQSISERIAKTEGLICYESKHTAINEILKELYPELDNLTKSFYRDLFLKIHEHNVVITGQLESIANLTVKSLGKNAGLSSADLKQKDFYRIWNDTQYRIKELTEKMLSSIENDRASSKKSLDGLIVSLESYIEKLPDKVRVRLTKDDLRLHKSDSFRVKIYKSLRIPLLSVNGGSISQRINVRKAFRHVFMYNFLNKINELLLRFHNNSFKTITEFRKLSEELKDFFYEYEKQLVKDSVSVKMSETFLKDYNNTISDLNKSIETGMLLINRSMVSGLNREITALIGGFEKAAFKYYFKKHKTSGKKINKLKQALLEYPDIWSHNVYHFSMQMLTDSLLSVMVIRFKSRILKTYSDIYNRIKSENIRKFDLLTTRIEEYLIKSDSGADFEYELDDISFNQIHLAEIFEDVYESLKTYTDDISENIKLAHPDFYDTCKLKKNELIEVIDLPLKKHVDHVVNGVFYENMINVIGNTDNEINRKFSKLNNLLNLSRYNIDNIYINENLNNDDEKVSKVHYLKKLSESILLERKSFLESFNSFHLELSNYLKESFDQVNLEHILNFSAGTQTTKSKRIRLRLLLKFTPLGHLRRFSQGIIETLLYGRSVGILMAKRIRTSEDEQLSGLDTLIRFVEDHTPSPEILEKLPFYYKNLFNNKFTVTHRFWTGRGEEIAHADKAVEQYRVSGRGAIMILGERNSGKTSLCNMIAQKHFAKDKIFQLYPPRQGSCEEDDFIAALSKSLDSQGSLHELMHKIPEQSVIIINDLALWWERTEHGFVVVDLIINLIRTYSKRCLFLLNSNIHSYTFISKYHKLNDKFTAIIRCNQLSTLELRNLILSRHQSGELKFRYGKTPENLMIEWKYAQLFNEYFNYSGGIIGTALNAWLKSIKSISNNEIIIEKPEKPDLSAFDQLSSDSLVILTQLILHRRLNKERMKRIMLMEEDVFENEIHLLLTSRLISRLFGDVIMMNSYIEPHFAEYLKSRRII